MLSQLLLFSSLITTIASLKLPGPSTPGRGISSQAVLGPHLATQILHFGDQPVSPGVPLHILPLGDSITEGYGSSDHNGYRLLLRSLLRHDDVTYLGSLHTGNMTNNAHEGHDGYTIREITSAFRDYDGEDPNVVLLHAGTNDMNTKHSISIETRLQRLGLLVDEILRRYPTAAVIVAKIIRSSFDRTQDRIKEYDSGIPAVIDVRSEDGYKVLLADMSRIGEHGRDLADYLHPNDAGYSRMATIWYSALVKAASKGWILPPEQ